MLGHDGMRFSTFDCDHDTYSGNCATQYKGAWWYKGVIGICHVSNLNGLYLSGHHTSLADGIEWVSWHGLFYSLKSSKMMIAKR